MRRSRRKKRTVSLARSKETTGVVHVSAFTDWRGGEQQLVNLYRELERKGFRQTIVCAKGSSMEAYCRVNHLGYISLRKRAGFDPIFGMKLRKIIKDLEADVVHAHDAHSHSMALMAKLMGGGGLYSLVVSRRVDFPLGNSFLSRFKYNSKHVSRVICVSNAIREIAKEGVEDPEKLVTVHSGVDPGRFDRKRKEQSFRKELGLSESVPLVGNIGALAEHKDPFTFIDTAAYLKENMDEVYFPVVGKGALLDEVRQHIRKRGMEKQVILTGFREDIPSVLADLDVLLVPSKTEGLGTTILDAFVAGVPVVATRAGGIPEMVEHERTGLLADVGDFRTLGEHVKRLLSDEELRDKVVSGAREKVRDFFVDRMAEKTVKVYEEVKEEREKWGSRR